MLELASFGLIGGILSVLVVVVVFFLSLHSIGQTEVGLVTKKFSLKKLTDDNPIAFNGEAGYQADLLMPGLRWKLWPVYRVEKFPWIQVPAGEIGIVIAQVGKMPPIGSKSGVYKKEFGLFTGLKNFVTNEGEKGVQRPVLPPGTLAPIHPVGFIVITKKQVYGLPIAPELEQLMREGAGLTVKAFGLEPKDLDVVQIMPQKLSDNGEAQDVVGIVTTLEGDPLESSDIAGRLGGFEDVAKMEIENEKGNKTDSEIIEVLLTRKNTLHNNYQDFQAFLTAGGKIGLQHDPLPYGAFNLNPFLVKVELVPMLVVKQGQVAVIKSYLGLPTIDTSGEQFKFGSIVQPGHRGVWQEPLRTGKYAINPRIYQPEIVPTEILTLNWAEATSQAHTLDKHLSQIAAKSKEGFVFKIDLQVQIHVPDTKAPKVISMVGTIHNLVNEVLQPAVGNHFRDKLQSMAAIDFIQQRQIVQATAEEHIRIKLQDYEVETRGVYIQDVILPEELVQVLKDRELAAQNKLTYTAQKLAQTERAYMEAERGKADKQSELGQSEIEIAIKENRAKARKHEADGEATYTERTMAAEGIGKAKGYEAQRNAIGQDATAVVNAIEALTKGQRFVPDILVTSGGNGNADILGGVAALLMKSMNNNGDNFKRQRPFSNESELLIERPVELVDNDTSNGTRSAAVPGVSAS